MKFLKSSPLFYIKNKETQYFIGGTGSGIVTVATQPAIRRIVLMERLNNFPVVQQTWSNADGTYELRNLNPDKTYLVMAVDDKKQYEPVAWDFIKPAVKDHE